MSDIEIFGPYGDVRKAAAKRPSTRPLGAAEDTPHGLTPRQTEQLAERMEQFLPSMSNKFGSVSDVLGDILPEGANLDPGAGGGYHEARRKHANISGGSMSQGGSFSTVQRPYQPEFECVLPDTPVMLPDGSTKRFADLEVGERVLGSDGCEHVIERHWNSGTPDELVEVKLWGGETFTTTVNHKWPVFAHCGCGESVKAIPRGYQPLQKLQAVDLQPGDFVLVPRRFDAVEVDVTPDKARLLGYYVAEGSVDWGVDFTFERHENGTWVADVESLLTGEGVEVTTDPMPERGATRVRTRYGESRQAGAALKQWVQDHAGCGSSNKTLSSEVMRWPLELKRQLITGMFRGDGSQFWAVTKGPKGGRSFTVSYATASQTLARQTVLLLAQLGFPARVVPVKEPRNAAGAHYRVDVKGGQYPRSLADMVWGEASKARDHERGNNIAHACMVDDDYVYVPIKSVTVRPNVERTEVYNVTVSASDSNYCIGSRIPVLTSNSPDRQQYPVHRILANRYWRLFYKLDHVIGNGIDMYAELPWGNVEFSGDGVDGEVKDLMEYAWDQCQMRSILPYATREYMVVGEAGAHLYWDDSKNCWTYCALHNPDQLEVIDAPFIKMDPVVEFIPDERLMQVLTSNHATLRQVRESMPPELINRLMSKQNIPLSPVNFTFIPRKLHPYDTRGTSIISRMWRILMYEDCLPYGTRVARADGMFSNIEDVEVGDKVLDREGLPARVTNVVSKDAQEVREFSLLGGKKVTSTLTHKWPVLREGRHQKVEAADVRVGDYFMVPRTFEEVPSPYSLDLARLGGYYLAEGCITKTGHLTFTFHEDERDTLAQDVLDLLGSLDVEASVYPYNGRSAVCVRAHKQTPELLDLILWLEEHFGKGSATKRLSGDVMSWPVEWKREMLIGYLRGDGSCQIRRTAPVCSVTTVSEVLYEQLWLVFAQLGWTVGHSRVHEHCGSDGRSRLPSRKYTFSGEVADWMAEHIFDVQVNRTNGARPRKNRVDARFVYYKVKAVETPEPCKVIGLTVEGDHSYVAGGFSTYNSIYNASIATARRHAGPLKVAKLGNPQNGWIPGPEHERKLLELLAQAELDVNCFVPETPVVLGDGTERAIGDLSPGDVVLDRLGQPTEVAAVKREQTTQLVRLHIAGDESVDCTPNHAWPVWGGPRTCSCGCGTPIHAGNFAPHHGTDYRGGYAAPETAPTSLRRTKLRFLPDFDPHQRLEAKDIRAGDWLKIPRAFKERATDVTPDQAWLLGLYAADGNSKVVYERVDGSQRVGFEISLHASQTDLADRVDATVGYTTNRFVGDRNNLQIRANRNESSDLAAWLAKMCPGHAVDKQLHVDVMQWPLELKRAFLEGYVAGDGCVVGNKYVEIGTASRQLARQVKLIVAHLGALAAFSTRRQSKASYGAGNAFYRLHIHGALAAELGGFEPKRHHRAMSWADDDYVYVRVTAVEHIDCAPREVINIAVCGDHSYMVNGVGTFNSWLVYHYGINFELVGTTERVMSIDKHNEVIERVKLIALGISKAFLHGEVTYACLPYNTHVQSLHGLTPIQDLRPGDAVIAGDGSLQTVVEAWCEGTPETLTEITVSGSRTVQSTHTHRWPVHRDGQVHKLPASDVRVGDALLTPRTFEERPTNITPEQARLLGYYVAEGSTYPDNGDHAKPQVCWSLHDNEDETLAVDIENCVASLGLGTGVWQPTMTGNRRQVRTARAGGWTLGRWLVEHGGSGAHHKQLSADVMSWPLALKEELVRAAFKGDGSQTLVMRGNCGPYLQVSYTTASKTLALQLWQICIQLGYYSSVMQRTRRDNREGWSAQTEHWALQFQSSYAQGVADLVWGESSLAAQVKKRRSHKPEVWMDEQYAYLPVKRVAVVANDKPVYNIEVTGPHTYVAEGLATHNSAASGLTVFLQRLKALRQHFEQSWLMPKFFFQMAKMNKWIKPTEAELSGRIRVRRSHREALEDARYIMPNLEWDRALDPSVDQDMISAIQNLDQLGVKFSKSTLFSLVGRDFEEETKQRVRDYEFEQKELAEHPELLQTGGEEGGLGGGGGGGGILPPMDPGSFGDDLAGPPDEGGGPPPDESPEAGYHGDADNAGAPDPFKNTDRVNIWTKSDITDLMDLMAGEEPEDEPWLGAFKDPRVRDALATERPDEIWEALEEYLVDEQFPSSSIRALVDILKQQNVLQKGGGKVRRENRAKEAQLLDFVDEYEGTDFLKGA